jgi:hypothetical protein
MRIESLLASLKTALPQDAIVSGRLKDFPGEALRANRHMTRVMVPVSVAHLLKHRPHLISKIVETFFYRDELDIRAGTRLRRFPSDPAVPQRVLVATQLRFTRCLYAQATQQTFYPPKAFQMPPEWRTPQHPRHQAAFLGAKITAGLEMYYQNLVRRAKKEETLSASSRPRAVSNPGDENPSAGADSTNLPRTANEDLCSDHDEAWAAYKQHLTTRGFFGEFYPLTPEYKTQEAKAKTAYLAMHVRHVAL